MDTAAKNIRVGITTDELDKIVHEVGTDYTCDLSTFCVFSYLFIYLLFIFKHFFLKYGSTLHSIGWFQ